jgi:ABC-2 type transport system ATP-binding protein
LSLISARDLTKAFSPSVVALDNLSFDVSPGIIGFVGANGAGKTTFIRILLGLLAPTSGSASVLDMDVRGDQMAIRRVVGYMPENDCLPIDVSGADFVAHMGRMSGLPFQAARERAAEMLRHVGLHEERYRLIGGYSTGMKQRVKLAQALVHDPRLLLLDEPTNGLDPTGRDEMLELVRRTGTEFGIAVIVASHLLGEIERVCDFLVAVEGGRLLSAAPLGSFTERTGAVAVEVEEGREALAERLTAAGLTVRIDGRRLLVALSQGDGTNGAHAAADRVNELREYDLIRDAIVDLGLPLVRIEPERRSLEDLFR